MIRRILVVGFSAAFVLSSGAALAYVGGNTVVKYPTVAASKNRTVTKHGVGGNAMPSYSATPASKNKKVINHGVGGNSAPSYPAAAKK
jgi:hypothetical protein